MKDTLAESIDIKKKVKPADGIYGHRVIALQIYRCEGNLSLERAKKFAVNNSILKSAKNEGFETWFSCSDKELNLRYGKAGYRRRYFKTNQGRFSPQQVECVNNISNIRIVKKNGIAYIYVYGGGEDFIDKNVRIALTKLINFCDCNIRSGIISQSLIKKLCLKNHRRDVELIKIDPSKSENYAKIKEELEEEANKTRLYEFIVKENIMKGEHIMESKAIKKLFKDEPDIEITDYKSALYALKNGSHKIKYRLNVYGRIIFYTNNQFLKAFGDDEFEAVQFLLEKLESDAEDSVSFELVKKRGKQKSLGSFFRENANVDMIYNHIKKKEFAAAVALISDLPKYDVDEKGKSKLMDCIIESIKVDSHSALEMLKIPFNILSDEDIKAKENGFRDMIEKMDPQSRIDYIKVFLESGRVPLINLANALISNEVLSKNDLEGLWVKCLKEKDKHKKGKLLEEFLPKFFCRSDSFELSKLRKRTENEEIDLELKNKAKDGFWLQMNSPFVFAEAKNWSSKAGSADVKVFKDKIISHGNLCRLGFMVSVNGFTGGCETEKIRIVGQNSILVLIDGEDINRFFETDISITDFLEDMVSLAIK